MLFAPNLSMLWADLAGRAGSGHQAGNPEQVCPGRSG
jgi:hypothetical protein